jgi:hypothetical protein
MSFYVRFAVVIMNVMSTARQIYLCGVFSTLRIESWLSLRADGTTAKRKIIATVGNQTLNLQRVLSFFSDYSDKLYYKLHSYKHWVIISSV